MAEVVIYTKSWCGYCRAAKRFLDQLGVVYREIDAEDSARYQEMLARSGGRGTVPEIFIDGECIGGYTEMMELDESGALRPLLGM